MNYVVVLTRLVHETDDRDEAHQIADSRKLLPGDKIVVLRRKSHDAGRGILQEKLGSPEYRQAGAVRVQRGSNKTPRETVVESKPGIGKREQALGTKVAKTGAGSGRSTGVRKGGDRGTAKTTGRRR